jgi:hypothetical protein
MGSGEGTDGVRRDRGVNIANLHCNGPGIDKQDYAVVIVSDEMSNSGGGERW